MEAVPSAVISPRCRLQRCPSLMSAGGRLMKERRNVETPVMMMVGSEDYVLGAEGVEACRQFSQNPRICWQCGYCN